MTIKSLKEEYKIGELKIIEVSTSDFTGENNAYKFNIEIGNSFYEGVIRKYPMGWFLQEGCLCKIGGKRTSHFKKEKMNAIVKCLKQELNTQD